MTHEDLTTRLRDPRPVMSIDAQTLMLDAADRLDRYESALRQAKAYVGYKDRHSEIYNIIEAALR